MSWLILIGIIATLSVFTPAITGAAFITIGGTILGIVSKLLDLSLLALVVKFDTIIYGSLSSVIAIVWTAFRDLANILIIGMLTFTAISIILELNFFNAKKMVARVLIIALLINFSLLFTRLIVASSNFVAAQFYCAMAAEIDKTAACGRSATTGISDILSSAVSDKGIGGQFMQFLGVVDLTKSYETTRKVFDANKGGWDSTLTFGIVSFSGSLWAIMYGILSAVLMISAALVFAYAIFLLLARTILFVFLLTMSALAFGAFLIPKKGEQYWNMWWSSLIRSAIFGPLLMMTLWATFLISKGLVEGLGRGRSFDALFSSQASGSGYLALLVFAIILGMLYASIRFANSFSKGIQGFDWGTMAAGIPLALGARLGGMFGRRFIGGGAARYAAGVGDELSDARTKAARIANWKPTTSASFARKDRLLNAAKDDIASLQKKQNRASWIADRKFDIASTEAGKKFFKEAGVPGAVAGGGKGVASYGEYAKKTAEDAAKRAAETTTLSRANLDAVRAAAAPEMKQQRDLLQRGVQVAERAAQQQEAQNAQMIRAQSDITRARGEQEIIMTRSPSAQRDADMQAEEERIDRARQTIAQERRQIETTVGLRGQNNRRDALRNMQTQIQTAEQDAVRNARAGMRQVGEQLAGDIAYGRKANFIPWAVGGDSSNDYIAQAARANFNKRVQEDSEDGNVRRTIQRLMQQQNQGGGGAAGGAGGGANPNP